MSSRYNMNIGGAAVSATSYSTIFNPANTNEVVGEAPIGANEHLELAIAAASRAFESWRYSDESDRIAACKSIAKVCAKNTEELAMLLTKEQGKPIYGLGSRFELGACAHWADAMSRISLPDKVLEQSDERHAIQTHMALGVVGSITPLN